MSNDASRGTIWRLSTIQIGCNGSLIFLRLNCGRNLPWRQHCCIGAALDWMLEPWDLQLQLQHPRWTWGWRPTSNLYLTRSPRTRSMMDMTLRVGKTLLSGLLSSSLSSSPFCLHMLFPSKCKRQTLFKFRFPDHDWSKSSHESCTAGPAGHGRHAYIYRWSLCFLSPFLQRVCKTPGNSTKIHLAFCQGNQGQDLQVILGWIFGITKFRLSSTSSTQCTGQDACWWWLWDKVAQGPWFSKNSILKRSGQENCILFQLLPICCYHSVSHIPILKENLL